MRVLYGTGNQAKLSAMQRRLSSLDIEIIGLKDLEADIPEVPEDGKTPDAVQPGVHVRTVNGKYLTDEEMIAYYTGMAQKYGDLTSRYKNAICFVYDDAHRFEAMRPSMESEPFLLTSKPHSSVMNKGFPLDSLSVDIKSGKYFYDLPRQDMDQVAVEDGFLQFFQEVLGQIK